MPTIISLILVIAFCIFKDMNYLYAAGIFSVAGSVIYLGNTIEKLYKLHNPQEKSET